MGVRILHDRDLAALYCSTTGRAFGPIFHSTERGDAYDHAEAFLDWLAQRADTAERDPRRLTPAELEALYVAWLPVRDTPEEAHP